ncbi:MAG TPA: DUF488 family protein [Nocardioidaceae bacterium]|nr:DUF488 family protein [Nocardioidaceae bacterium]
MATIELRRVHDVVGERKQAPTFLVDRIWPRGVAKDDLDIDAWVRDIAPSTELRKWFGHDPARWAEFRKRYLSELAENSDAAEPLLNAARNGRLVLLFAAKDTEHNQAVVIREWLQRHKL